MKLKKLFIELSKVFIIPIILVVFSPKIIEFFCKEKIKTSLIGYVRDENYNAIQGIIVVIPGVGKDTTNVDGKFFIEHISTTIPKNKWQGCVTCSKKTFFPIKFIEKEKDTTLYIDWDNIKINSKEPIIQDFIIKK